MYNYHKYLEDQNRQQRQLKNLSEQIQQTLRRKHMRVQLAESYQNRLQKHIHQIVSKPIVITDYHNPSENWKLREVQRQKMLKDPQIYIRGFKKQKDRINVTNGLIQRTIEENKTCDTTPVRSVSLHQFRERQPQKQIQPGMRYTNKTGVERVQEFVKKSMMTQVQNEEFHFDKKKFDEQTHNLSLFEKRSYMSRQVSKHLLPSLHQKTHFKAMKEISDKIRGSKSLQTIKKPSISAIEQKRKFMTKQATNPQFAQSSPREKDQTRSEMNTTRRNMKPKFDPAEASKKLLLACNVTKQKNVSVPVLHKGQGKMFFDKISV